MPVKEDHYQKLVVTVEQGEGIMSYSSWNIHNAFPIVGT